MTPTDVIKCKNNGNTGSNNSNTTTYNNDSNNSNNIYTNGCTAPLTPTEH